MVLASALGQPQDLVTTCVVTHPGTRHVRQAVPVEVSVGQLGAGAQFCTVVVLVCVLTTVVVLIRVAVTLRICVTTLVWTDVVVVVCVVGTKTVLVDCAHVPPVAPGLVQVLPTQTVVGVTVICPAVALWLCQSCWACSSLLLDMLLTLRTRQGL